MSQLVKELEETKHTHRYWEVQRLLRKIEPNGSTLQLLDDQGITSTHLLKLNTIVRQFYENFSIRRTEKNSTHGKETQNHLQTRLQSQKSRQQSQNSEIEEHAAKIKYMRNI